MWRTGRPSCTGLIRTVTASWLSRGSISRFERPCQLNSPARQAHRTRWASPAAKTETFMLKINAALIIVDLQHDFTPGGALPVAEGDQILPLANALAQRFDTVVATQDWHPANHGSFAANHPGRSPGDMIDLNGPPQILWPTHCVQNTRGAEFVPGE